MEVKIDTQHLEAVIPTEPIFGVHNVDVSMAQQRRHLATADLKHVEPFSFTYLTVNNNLVDRLDFQNTTGEEIYKQPQVLDTATGIFHYHYARQLLAPEKHWATLIEDPRARAVDPATQFALGMMAHIGGDLGRTVYETTQTTQDDMETPRYEKEVMEEYVRCDYSKIDELLRDTAIQVAPVLLEKVENEKVQRALVEMAVGGVALGRWWAKRDYRSLEAAKSEDERQHIIQRSHTRTAKLTEATLGFSYEANTWLRSESQSAVDKKPVVIDLADNRIGQASRIILQLTTKLGSGIRKIAA